MEVKATTSKEQPQELTYEQLNAACSQLYQEKQMLLKRIEMLNQTSMFKRLDYLFMVLQYADIIKDPDFVGDCIAEIKGAIAIPEQGDDSEENK
jgi:hypothetical protein